MLRSIFEKNNIHSKLEDYNKIMLDAEFWHDKIKSKNIIKEYNNYYWEELKDGTIVNKPKDKFNHAMDSIRYGVYSQYGKKQNFFVI